MRNDFGYCGDVITYSATGSSVICPSVAFVDIDYIMLVKDMDYIHPLIADKGYTATSSDGYVHDAGQYGVFKTARKQVQHGDESCDINLIITKDPKFYFRFLEATELATLMNLKEKEQRKTLFAYILYGWQMNE